MTLMPPMRSRYRLALAALVLAVPLAPAAQELPGFGEGAWSWETLAPQATVRSASEVLFDWDGRLLLGADELYRYDPDADAWVELEGPRLKLDGGITLGRDTLVSADITKARTTDGLQSWQEVCVVDFEIACEESWDGGAHGVYEIPAGRAFGGRLLSAGRVYSDDRGGSWQTATVAASEDGWTFLAKAFASLPSGRVLMAGDWGVATSDTGGAVWELSPLWAPYGVFLYAVAEWATPGSTQAAAAGGPPAACGLADAALCDGAVAVGANLESERAWWTNDGGRSWTDAGPLPQVVDGCCRSLVGILRELDRAGADAGGAEAGSTGLGRGLTSLGRGFVYATLDGGQSWEVVARVPFDGPGTIGGKKVLSAEVGPDGRLYAAVHDPTDHVYRTKEPAAAAFAYLTAEAEGAAPSEGGVSLSVVPNPSGGVVRIELTTGAPTSGTVEVWDALGRRVAELHAGALAAGTHAFVVDASRLAPGVYTAVARLDGEAESVRFTLTR